jgi:hypothetical protein
MKKILVVLLVLAAATGVFAQDGEWSLGGNVEIGAIVDFTQDSGIPVEGSTYNVPYEGWGPIHGFLSIGYNLDQLKTSIGISSQRDNLLQASLSYDAGNYALAAEIRPFQWGTAEYSSNVIKEQRLWGYYKFLNDMVKLEAAYSSADNGDGLWTSDKTAAFIWGSSAIAYDPWKGGDTFAKADGATYLLTDVSLSNLEFGIRLPNIFPNHQMGNTGALDLLDDVMKEAIVGLKFNMQPIEVAAQFQMGNYGVYFGGKWFIGPVTAGLSFTGILDPDDPFKKMRFGGGVEYNPGVFGATIKAFYGLAGTRSNRTTQVGIEPGFFYNVIPSHLQFRTDVGFYFSGGRVSDAKQDLEVGWAVQPQLFWNFLGTGAGTYWSYGTGLIVRYRLVADEQGAMGKVNAFDVNFKFSF